MALTKVSEVTNPDVVEIVQSNDSVDEIAMSVDMEGMSHIIARLTDLYTNPIEAASRETISNAVDATAMLPFQKRKPVEITLPSPINPALTIRDYGVGMSLEEVKKNYSQYGASTKRSDMNQTGAYGLGAKAPLAYCSEFSVATTKEGWTTVFQMSRTPKGNFLKIHSHTETGQESGTLVQIPARAEDLNRFREAISSYQKFSFSVPIKVDGVLSTSDDYTLLRDDLVLDKDSQLTTRVWLRKEALSSFTSTRYTDSSGSTHFAYVLSGWKYNSSGSSETFRGYHNSYYNSPKGDPDVIVELRPGVVDFSSSRDEIMQNERSAALDRLVLAYLQDKTNRSVVDDLLKLYRGLDDESAFTFFSKLYKNSNDHTAGELNLISRFTHNLRAFKEEDFITDSGYSPMKHYNSVWGHVAFAGFKLGTAANELPIFTVDTPSLSIEVTNFKRFNFTNSTVSVARAMLLKAADGMGSTIPLAPVLLAHKMLSIDTPSQVFGSPEKVYLVEVKRDLDSIKNLQRVLSMRKLLSENAYGNATIMLTRNLKLAREQVSQVEDFTGVTVQVITLEELLEYGSSLRKAARSVAVKPKDLPMMLNVMPTDKTTEADVLASVSTYRLPTVHITPEEIMESNAIVVVTKSDASSVLIGAANSGMDILTRPIYLAVNNKSVRAAHFKSLRDYDGLIMHKEHGNKGRDALAIAAERTYHGRNLISALKLAEKTDLIRSIFSSYYTSPQFFANLEAYLDRVNHANAELVSAVGLIRKTLDTRGRTYYNLSDDEIRLGLNDDKTTDILMALRQSIAHNAFMKDFDYTLMAQLISHRAKVEGQAADLLFSIFVESLEAKESN